MNAVSFRHIKKQYENNMKQIIQNGTEVFCYEFGRRSFRARVVSFANRTYTVSDENGNLSFWPMESVNLLQNQSDIEAHLVEMSNRNEAYKARRLQVAENCRRMYSK